MRYIFILFILISCSNNNNLHLSNLELLDNIMKEHDELILEMKTKKILKRSLLKIDEIEEDNEAIKDLHIARMSMMKFIKDFSNEISFDKYPMDKKNQQP